MFSATGQLELRNFVVVTCQDKPAGAELCHITWLRLIGAFQVWALMEVRVMVGDSTFKAY